MTGSTRTIYPSRRIVRSSRRNRHCYLFLASVACLALFSAAPVDAAEIPPTDLEAAVRTFGFIETLPRDGTFVVGVVFPSGGASGGAEAARTASRLSAIQGPNHSAIRAAAMPVNVLAQRSERLDVLFLMP